MSPRRLRCAIYTRKSSEEGLEQDFNSLDAQREACEAYIASQRHEGWTALPTRYDDGGYSGATLDRPAVQRLLSDVKSGHIDLIVVYKIDRLTRALTDFASLVTVLDTQHTSFVSVTQHFNTTTSMGRLTLNVLLSFAQFEREVTGERIRDKIAASKRKGMWMGGTIPFGYVVNDRQLQIDPDDAQQVSHLFRRYCVLGSVALLKAELDAQGQVSKVRLSRRGRTSGGQPYSRGALYLLLKNRVYRGEIAHKGKVYQGQHAALVEQPLWDAVQAQLHDNREARHLGSRAKQASLLAGMVKDATGSRLTPTHTVKRGRRYRYYLGRKSTSAAGGRRCCVPAHALEQLVTADFLTVLRHGDLDGLLDCGPGAAFGHQVRAHALTLAQQWPAMTEPEQRRWWHVVKLEVVVREDQIGWSINPATLAASLHASVPTSVVPSDDRAWQRPDRFERTVAARVIRCGGQTRVVTADGGTPVHSAVQNEPLLKAVARGRQYYLALVEGRINSVKAIAAQERVPSSYISRLLRCGMLAPDLVEQLIDGTAGPQLNLKNVCDHLPLEWDEQRLLYGTAISA